MKIWIFFLSMTLSFYSAVSAGDNLLKNGELTVGEGKSVTGWKMWPKNAVISNDDKDVPEGISKSLKVTVNEVAKNDGYLSQTIYLKGEDAQFFAVSANIKSGSSRCGYIQVKLLKDKKELKRIKVGNSKKEWVKSSKSFSSEGANKIMVLCRWRQYDRYQGSAVWFAGVQLERIDKIEKKIEKMDTTIALVGDSTVQDYAEDSSKRGWGQVFPAFVKSGIAVSNHAAGGRSTKTFRSEGRWKKVLASKPDFVLIQFGHNDSHEKGRPEATDAGGEYKDLLKLYIKEARQAGIIPVLVTPPHRRVFRKSTGKLGTALKPYAENMKAVALAMKVPCIDLYGFSEEQMAPLGADGCIPLFCSRKDRSHFSEKGANLLAGYIAEELKKVDKIKELIK